MGSLQGVTRLEKLTSNLAPLRTLTISGKLKPVSHLLCRRWIAYGWCLRPDTLQCGACKRHILPLQS